MADTGTTATNISDPEGIAPGTAEVPAAAAASGYHRPASLPPVIGDTPGEAVASSASEQAPAGQQESYHQTQGATRTAALRTDSVSGAGPVVPSDPISQEEVDFLCLSDTSDEAMAAHAEGCVYPLAWNQWQQVARAVASRYDDIILTKNSMRWLADMRVAINVAKWADDWKSAKSPQWEIPRPSSAPQPQIRRDLPTATGLSDSAPGAEGGFLMGGRSSASPTGTEEQGNEQQRAPLLAPRPSSKVDLVTMALRETTAESKEGVTNIVVMRPRRAQRLETVWRCMPSVCMELEKSR